MKNTKRILSVVLAVVMVLSTLAIVAYAHTYNPGVEDTTATNVKLEVTQVASFTNGTKTVTATDNDIYAVTVYAKVVNPYGMSILWIPVKYDTSKFALFMDYDGNYTYSDFYWDNFYSESEVYTLPARFSDPNMYDADDQVVTAAKNAVACGLGYTGKPTPGTLTFKADAKLDGVDGADQFVDFSTDTGVVLCKLQMSLGTANIKSSLLNTVKGHLINNDYLEMFTIYFKRLCSETEAYNQSFGIETASDNGTSCTLVPTNGNPGYNKEVVTDGQVNYVANAVEAAVKPLVSLTAGYGAKSQQIAFNSATSVDYRFVAQFSTTAFPITYDESTEKITATDIDEVGFVMTKVGEGDAATIAAMSAADVAALSKTEGTYRKVWTTRISTDMAGGAAFAFSCRIAGITVTGGVVSAEYIAVPYVISSGAITFGQAMQSGVQARYDAYHVQAGF